MTKVLKIWLDDCRAKPDRYDVWIRTHNEARALFAEHGDCPMYISFDHDLGDERKCGTGYTIACLIEEKGLNLAGYRIHSANPVGARRIRMALRNYREKEPPE